MTRESVVRTGGVGRKVRRRVDAPLGTARTVGLLSRSRKGVRQFESGSGARGSLNARPEPFGKAFTQRQSEPLCRRFLCMDIALERAPICAMGQPFDGEAFASLLSLALRDSGAEVAALLQIGGNNSASEPAVEGQRNARSR
jgi:hypothetical protein